jgi:hypothetical protein
MKKLLRLSALAAALNGLASCASVQSTLERPVDLKVIEQYDRFRDTRRWTTQYYFVEGGPKDPSGIPQLTVGATAVAFGPNHPQAPNRSYLALLMSSESKDWRFLESGRDVDLILDGSERMHLGTAEFRSSYVAAERRCSRKSRCSTYA